MAVRKILRYGADILRQRTKPVPYDAVKAELPGLLRDMWETCASCNGVGLAANQIGLPLRLAVIALPVEKDKIKKFVLLNPKITEKAGQMEEDEGCLSFPGFFAPTVRYAVVKVRALDENGQEYELVGRGLLAKALQHEIDHLDGKLLIDRIPSVEKSRAKAHLKEVAKTWDAAASGADGKKKS
ncbi:MAG TPA: peptide deformylase [Elusimicrobiales bacterium]|nr:peptide deformylase [Elusimicrobiales bacterium]